MSDFGDIPRRIAAAPPATRLCLRASQLWFLAALSVVVIAWFATHLGPGLGVHVHPPVAVLVLAHGLAAVAAPASVYFWLYVGGSLRLGSAATALTLGAVTWGLTLGSLAWAVPVLSLSAVTESGMVERRAEVTGHSTGSRRALCDHGASFGHWYAPGGVICYGHRSVNALVGATLEMEGHGNGWATRITRIKGVLRT